MITTIIIFVLVLGILVLVHELGHFWAAKMAKCDVEEFAIGFPPKLFKLKRKGTDYLINLLPIGGYVKIKGENGDTESNDPGSFANKSVGWKAIIVSAGVIMNVILAYILITIGLIIGVPTMVSQDQDFGKHANISNRRVEILQTLPDSPANQAQLQTGDVFICINGESIESIDSMHKLLNDKNSEESHFVISREDQIIETSITPTPMDELEGKSGIGVALAETADLSYPWYIAWWYGFKRTFLLLWMIIVAFVGLFQKLFTGGGLPEGIAGPVGIAALSGQMAALGITHLIQFVAMLSLNLAILNILPFPALDGGRLVLVALEKIRGKTLNIHLEKWIHVVGLAVLIALMFAVTVKDFINFDIINSIKNLF